MTATEVTARLAAYPKTRQGVTGLITPQFLDEYTRNLRHLLEQQKKYG